jgi:DhnA family fructose-bisphosphate aldolase class Ia
MQMVNVGQEVRLRDFIADDEKSLILDCTAGLKGTSSINLPEYLPTFKNQPIDGIILSPGEARQQYTFFSQKRDPALIVKCDWSNLGLDDQSPYPRQHFRHVSIASVNEAMRLGASAIIIDVFFGVEDKITAEDLRQLRIWAGDGYEAGIPVIANIIPFGPRITASNFADVTILGARMSLEIGATAIAIPSLNEEKLAFCKEISIQSPMFLNSYSNPYEKVQSIQNLLEGQLKKQPLTGIILECTETHLPIHRIIA